MKRLKDDSGMTIVEVMAAFMIILICVAALMGVMQLASKTLIVSGDFDDQTTVLSEKSYADKNYSYDAVNHKIVITEHPSAMGGTRQTTDMTFQEIGNAGNAFTIECSRVQTTDDQGRTYFIYTTPPVAAP